MKNKEERNKSFLLRITKKKEKIVDFSKESNPTHLYIRFYFY